MSEDKVRYHDEEALHLIIKHGLDGGDGGAEHAASCAFELCRETCDLINEMLRTANAGRWSVFRIRRQMRMAIDMLIDAERLESMTVEV